MHEGVTYDIFMEYEKYTHGSVMMAAQACGGGNSTPEGSKR